VTLVRREIDAARHEINIGSPLQAETFELEDCTIFQTDGDGTSPARSFLRLLTEQSAHAWKSSPIHRSAEPCRPTLAPPENIFAALR